MGKNFEALLLFLPLHAATREKLEKAVEEDEKEARKQGREEGHTEDLGDLLKYGNL